VTWDTPVFSYYNRYRGQVCEYSIRALVQYITADADHIDFAVQMLELERPEGEGDVQGAATLKVFYISAHDMSPIMDLGDDGHYLSEEPIKDNAYQWIVSNAIWKRDVIMFTHIMEWPTSRGESLSCHIHDFLGY
jgi:hypothetical protein